MRPVTIKVSPAPAGAKAKEDPARFSIPIKSTKQLLSAAGGDRTTTLVTLDLASYPFVQYSPGDHLVVYPENSPKVPRRSARRCFVIMPSCCSTDLAQCTPTALTHGARRADRADAAAVQVVAEVAQNLGLNAEMLDSLFVLDAIEPNGPEPFPTPIAYRDAIAHYLDLDATPSPVALAVFADCIAAGDPTAAEKLHKLAGSSTDYQKWVATEQPRWRDIWNLCPPLAGRLPIGRLFELCPATAPRYYSISSSLMATPGEVAITVGQLAYQLADGRKRKVRMPPRLLQRRELSEGVR